MDIFGCVLLNITTREKKKKKEKERKKDPPDLDKNVIQSNQNYNPKQPNTTIKNFTRNKKKRSGIE